MKDVTLGMTVITSNGNLGKVVGIYPQGVRSIYEITLQDRTKIRVSDEHLNCVWWYNDSKKKREDFVLTTKELIAKFKENKYKLRVDLPKVDFHNYNPLPIDPYLLGALISDGSLSSNNFSFSNSEDDIISKVDGKLRSQFNMFLQKLPGDNVDYDIKYCDTCYSKYVFTYKNYTVNGANELVKILNLEGYPKFDEESIIRICEGTAPKICDSYPELKGAISYQINDEWESRRQSSSLKNILKELNLNVKSVDKHIPELYLTASYEDRLELLRGLFDTDGYIDKQGLVIFTTSSSTLSEDFAHLVRSLGIRDTVVKDSSYYTDKIHNKKIQAANHYDHNLKIDNNLLFYSSKKHKNRWKPRQNPPLRNIVSIEYIGEDECQCIMIDHEDHTYISDDFIPTHNTTTCRIVANMMNNGVGTPIELDCASNNRSRPYESNTR